MLTGDIFYKLRSIPDDQEKRHYLCTHLLHRCRYLGFSQFAYCLVWSGQTALAKDIGIDVDAVPSCPYDGESTWAKYAFMNLGLVQLL